MKFLILVKNRTQGPHPADPIALNRSVSEWVKQRIMDGSIDCAYYVIPEMGMCILNADSHEALLGSLRAWPAFSFVEFQVYPLADITFGIDNNHERLQAVLAQQPEAHAE